MIDPHEAKKTDMGSRGGAETRRDLDEITGAIVELKSVEKLNPVNKRQLLTYFRLAGQSVGLLINFGQATLKEGLHRIVNNLTPSASPRLRVNQPATKEFPHG